MGIIKPFFLGFVIVTIACHVGLERQRRHAGRGPRDHRARSSPASVAVLAVDFFLTKLMVLLFY